MVAGGTGFHDLNWIRLNKSAVHQSVPELTLNLVPGLDLHPGALKTEVVECVYHLFRVQEFGDGRVKPS